MKNRITELFKKKQRKVLSVYFTAGFPKLNDTVTIIKELQKAGVDMIEIGIPYSDPLADGPTIQNSSEVALRNGMNLKRLFTQLESIRKTVSIPLLLMGYINPIIQYGTEKFCEKAKEIGIDGMIIPDLPMREYLDIYKCIFERNNLSNIFLITPQSSDERIRWIDENTTGFIYIVSSVSITGKSFSIEHSKTYFERIRFLKLKNKTLIGFGISEKESCNMAFQYANGAIIGSAFIKAIENSSNLKKDIQMFADKFREE